jgi:hypothetical protein
VWVGNSRYAKAGHFHDTWKAAHEYLLNKAEREVANARRMLLSANSKLGNIKGMKPPAA